MWQHTYEKWLQSARFSGEAYEKLKNMSEEEKQESFGCMLSFGTAGLRGKMGLGTNRINAFTVAKAATGLAEYLLSNPEQEKKLGVAIAYDSRNHSQFFAFVAAQALATKGITAYIFKDLRPTPLLSFTVRHLNLSGGIVITASHNPPIYNGFKVYGSDGSQFPEKESYRLIQYVENVGDELQLEICTKEEGIRLGKIILLDQEVEEAYIQALDKLRLYTKEEIDSNVSVVFTALHGTAVTLFPQVMERNGFTNIHYVKEQCIPDGNFPTVEFPNPEEKSAFQLAIPYAEEVQGDLIIACDPDADRLGIAVRTSKGNYELLTGNQVGALCIDYLIQSKRKKGNLPQNGVLLDTIVTSSFAATIAKAYGLQNIRTLTGFKYIGEKMKEFEQTGTFDFMMGYEESYGYLFLDKVRDKDAIQASLLLVEMVAFYKKQNENLFDVLQKLYDKFGYFKEALESMTMTGMNGMEKIHQIMHALESFKVPNLFGRYEVKWIEDYDQKEMRFPDGTIKSLAGYPKSKVIKFVLANEAWICIRPSGTEPKIKFYYGVKESSHAQSREAIQELKAQMHNFIDNIK